MAQKTYYFIIAITLGLIAIYFGACVFSFNVLKMDIRPFNTQPIINLIVLLIIIYQTAHTSHKTYKLLNFILLPVAIIGFLFTIMHWPFGRILFFIPVAVTLFLLMLDNVAKTRERRTIYFIMAFPLVHLAYVYWAINHLPGQGIFYILDHCTMGIVASVVSVRLFNQHRSINGDVDRI